MLRFIISLFSGLSLLGLTACNEPTARSGQVTATGVAQIGGTYELVNQDGQTVTDQTFIGKSQLIYFGFSYCPDVCPLALQKLGAVSLASHCGVPRSVGENNFERCVETLIS